MRVDKWLYYARLYKSRGRSSKACVEGDILINRFKKNNSKQKVSINDIITIIIDQKIKIVKVLKIPKNRISQKKIKEIYKIIY